MYLRVLIIHSNKLEISQVLNSKGLVREIIVYHLGKCYIVIKNAVYRRVYGIITRANEKNPTKGHVQYQTIIKIIVYISFLRLWSPCLKNNHLLSVMNRSEGSAGELARMLRVSKWVLGSERRQLLGSGQGLGFTPVS